MVLVHRGCWKGSGLEKNMEQQTIIKTMGLTKRFGDITAVDNLNLEVLESRIHGFVGPNGAGKTTTMKMLVGAIHATKGKGKIYDKPISSLKARKHIGYSPEYCYFYPNLKALDYLIYMARLSGIRYKEALSKARKLMGILDLEKFENKQVSKFSAGMKKKMGLAQAMIHEPDILLLDEPTANLDPTGRMGIVDTLKELVSASKLTVFISSHVLSELELLVDYVTLINKGSIVLQGEINKIKSEYKK
jgi:ABC-type multidrug transport system ATPase subunit